MNPKFIQIAVTPCGCLYALDNEEGAWIIHPGIDEVWMKVTALRNETCQEDAASDKPAHA